MTFFIFQGLQGVEWHPDGWFESDQLHHAVSINGEFPFEKHHPRLQWSARGGEFLMFGQNIHSGARSREKAVKERRRSRYDIDRPQRTVTFPYRQA
jgi:hypothetical protein